MPDLRLSLGRDLSTLFRARLRSAGNGARLALRRSRLRVAIALVFAAVFWLGLFFFFYEGFTFINRFRELADYKDWILQNLFGLFFMTLMVLLMFSNGVIAYLGLLRSRETEFLVTNPLPMASVFLYKFTESLVFSSWALLLLGTPLLMAYGLTSDVPWYFFPMFFVYFLPFVVIPATVGVVATLLLAAYLPTTRLGWVVAALGGASVAILAVLASSLYPGRSLGPFTAQQMQWFFARLKFTQVPLLPSRWITRGVMAAAHDRLSQVGFYFLLLVSNALFVCLVAYGVAGRVYPRAWSRAQSGRRRRRRPGRARLDAAVHRLFFYLPRPARLLIVKDLRTFRRDAAQWSQVLIFFGILAAYIGNLRSFAYDLRGEGFRSMVSMLNLAVVGMVIATFACRFVFPLMSLEGQNFWLLGLAPIRRRSVLAGKFAFAAGGAGVMSVVLVVTSDVMLRTPLRVVAMDLAAMVMMSLGIAGISVGLGARLPSLDEDNPSKIAAGFGGTLNLIVSLFYIAVVVAMMGLPTHLAFAGNLPGRWGATLTGGLIAGAVLVTALAVALPMTLGIRHLERMEF